MNDMTIIDKVIYCFHNCTIGQEFKCEEIKNILKIKFNANESSIIPSDYCYNITNNGIKNYETYLHIFERIGREIGRAHV